MFVQNIINLSAADFSFVSVGVVAVYFVDAEYAQRGPAESDREM